MKHLLMFLLSAALPLGVAHAQPPDLNKVIAGCAMCHGESGNSASATVPRLNGQTSAYLASRLNSFRDPTRQSPHATYMMWSISESLADDRIAALAEYYARQTPTPLPAGGGAHAAEGERLYRDGPKGVGACSGCHGIAAVGMGATPRLAGQHGAYLRQALNDFGVQARVHDQMRVHSGTLSVAQTEALIAYLARD